MFFIFSYYLYSTSAGYDNHCMTATSFFTAPLASSGIRVHVHVGTHLLLQVLTDTLLKWML